MSRARFITLEGGEGAGKTTAMAQVSDWLVRQGREVIQTREPGGTPAAERIRGVLLDPTTGELASMTELLLMFAARAENLAAVIRPALAEGRDVVSDRFTDASRAYQGGGRGIDQSVIDAMATLVHSDLRPDLTLLLDVPVEIGMSRVQRRGLAPDRIEQARAGFMERVRQAYLHQAALEPDRFVVIDASRPLEQVRQDIDRALEARL